MDLEESINRWLSRPLWPWPLALAYSVPPEKREDAIAVAVDVLDSYPKLGLSSAYAGLTAVDRVMVALGGPSSNHDSDGDETGMLAFWEGLEAPVIEFLRTGVLQAWGRDGADGPIERIDAQSWFGGEIISAQTCDLGREGWRRKSWQFASILDDSEPVIWRCDIHLERAGMIAAFGGDAGAPTRTTGAAGRPSSKHLAIAEMERRAANREICATLAGEASYLVEWLEANHKGSPPLRVPGCKNAIRHRFNELKARPAGA